MRRMILKSYLTYLGEMMKKFLTLVALCVTLEASLADEIYFPNLKKNASGTLDGSRALLDVNVALDGTTQNGGSSYVAGDKGGVALAVRKDSTGPLSGVDDGEYGPLQTDANGNLKVAATLSEEAVASPGSAVPAVVKVAGGTDGSVVTTLKTDAGGELQVDVLSSALPSGAATEATLSALNGKVTVVDTSSVAVVSSALPTNAATETTLSALNAKVLTVDTDDVIVTSSALPTGAATEATLAALNGKVTVVDTSSVAIVSSALPSGAATETTLSAINGKLNSLGQKTMANSVPVVIASDQSDINVGNISGTVSLPTGAATEATLSSLNGKVANDFGASSGAVRVAAIPGNASGIADFGAGAATLQTQRVVIVNDQSAVQIKAAKNATSSFSEDATVGGTAETFTAPANAVGMILQASSANVGNIRWRASGTATASSGHQLEPGRDTGFLPITTDISYINESTTGDYLSITWMVQ